MPTGKYVNDKGFVKEIEKEPYRFNTKYVGVYNEDKEGLEKFKRELNLAGNSDIPEHLIRRDEDGTVITYMDDTSRILNIGYSEGENFPDYDDQAKWRLKVKGKEWDDEFQKLKN